MFSLRNKKKNCYTLITKALTERKETTIFVLITFVSFFFGGGGEGGHYGHILVPRQVSKGPRTVLMKDCP